MKQEIKKEKFNINIRKCSLVDNYRNMQKQQKKSNNAKWLFKIDPKECATEINEAEAPKLICSYDFLDLSNKMFLINTVLLSNTKTWEELKNGSRWQSLSLSSRNLVTMLNEKEIFQWHSNENTLQSPSPDWQSHHLGIGYKKKQVIDPILLVR